MLNIQRKLTNYFLTNVHTKYKQAEQTRRKKRSSHLTTTEAGTLCKALNPSLDKSQLCTVRCRLCSSARVCPLEAGSSMTTKTLPVKHP